MSGSVDDLLKAAPASSLVLPADTAGGPAWFLVNVAGVGVDLLDQPSLDQTQRLGALTLNSAPAAPLGADPGESLVAQASRLAWLLLAAQATGAAERALRLTVEYAGTRRAFGQPIGRFQAVKHRVAEMLLSVENARSAAYNAAWAQDSGRADVALASHMAKAVGTENAVSVIQTAIQMHGGIGYTWSTTCICCCAGRRAANSSLATPRCTSPPSPTRYWTRTSSRQEPCHDLRSDHRARRRPRFPRGAAHLAGQESPQWLGTPGFRMPRVPGERRAFCVSCRPPWRRGSGSPSTGRPSTGAAAQPSPSRSSTTPSSRPARYRPCPGTAA